MNRRQFNRELLMAGAGLALAACGGKLTAPSDVVPSSLPSRVFDPRLGGEVFKSFQVTKDGPLYAAMQAAGITPGSSALVTSRDTKTGIQFQGNLIYYVITDVNMFQPENGFDFKINDREIYDPLSGSPLSLNFYNLPVFAGNSVSLTLPPKWNGISD